MRRALRAHLRAAQPIMAGGVGDAGQARLVEQVGYPAVYLSGSYVNNTRGYTDGTLTMTEMAQRVREVAERISIPLIADADEGFGGPLKIVRTIREYERAGASGLHIEDFALKKHGEPVPVQEMVSHLKLVLDTRTDQDMVIIARTDSMSPWRNNIRTDRSACEEDAFERALRYCEAGADAIMPLFATNSWLERYGHRIPKPLVVLGGAPKNWTGDPAEPVEPEKTAAEMKAWNVQVVLFSTCMLYQTYQFMAQQYAKWLAEGKFEVTPEYEQARLQANMLSGWGEKEDFLRQWEVHG